MTETILDPMLGRLVDGRYEVRERVAAGGMATVYLAFDRRLEREVALKVMHTRMAGDSDGREFVSRFRREAKAAARLTHPGMVRVYDQGVDGDVSYLTMEYVRGENLRHRISQDSTLPVGEALTIADAILDALAAAHRQGLVHRDVKPENVLIDEDGRPKVADFGLARAVTEVTATSTGTIMGTVAYLGPELVSRGQADARTDVYSVGILLYEMVTGRQPFTGASAIEVASRHVHEDIPAPSSHVPWLPPELDSLIETLAARDPNMRPGDAAAASALLRQTRAMMDDPTLDRRADSPSGSIPVVSTGDDTTVLSAVPSGSTVALPIGLGQPQGDLTVIEAEIIDDDPEAQDPTRPPHRVAWWVGAIAAALVVLSGLGLWWYSSVGPGAYTTVPPVEGVTEAEARAILEATGLSMITLRAYDDEVPEGIVVGSDPSEQSQVPNGGDVTVTVSRGPRMEVVPTVVGILEPDARKRIEDLGFPLGDITYVFSDTVPAGEVMEVVPTAGEEVRHNTPIHLTVSNGPEPIAVPDVVGKTEADAIGILEVYALDVTVIHEKTLEQSKGKVFKQDPAGGADGFRAQEVTIYVSDGKPQVEVPLFIFMPVDEAEQKAKDLGLEVKLRPRFPFSSKNEITDQSIDPGKIVDVGTTITLVYN